MWNALNKMTKPYWAKVPNETDLRIELESGGTICVRGADNYDSLRGGEGLNFIVFDEFSQIPNAAWTESLRPAFADREGGALFIGTPQGYNHFHELFDSARGRPDWETFQFTTAEGGHVSPEELESAAQELDERTYRQEFLATFETFGVGRAYHAFDRALNVKNLGFSGQVSLSWSLDFNMNPLCSVLAQVFHGAVFVLDELILPDSNTLAACQEFLARTDKWRKGSRLRVRVYGDSTADQRHTAATRTDWQIIREFMGRHSDRFDVTFHVPTTSFGEGSHQLRERPAAKLCWSTATPGQPYLQTPD